MMDVPLHGLEAAAAEVLDPMAYDYYAGGADDEITLAENVAAWRRIRMRPRVLCDVSHIDTAVEVVGTSADLPVWIAPMAYQGLADADGEAAMARGAASAGIPMIVSTMATTSLEDVAAAAPGSPRWFQLYIHKDRELTASLVRRAEAAGYTALMLTVDLAVVGNRRRDALHRFTLPPGLHQANLPLDMPATGESGLVAYAEDQFDPSVAYSELEKLVDSTSLPVVVKGVIRGDDAVACVDAGAAAVVVSNHGARQLDTCIATADALTEVVAATAGSVPVAVDGGVRSGTDIVKALAMGASTVLVGRPFLWGLALGGAEGVAAVAAAFRVELERAMALCGAASAAEVGFDLLA